MYEIVYHELIKLFLRWGSQEPEEEADDTIGVGFIEMPDDNEAREAIANLNGKDFDGRKLDVHDARSRP